MSDCLSADKLTQQEKMTACNKQAAEKKLAGDDRKKFMSTCLSG
ncbi:MAG TPA: PsiF family protein [Burkholderiaceae bacterium]|nr:PsiF family protein [Burkholderiaceae bacterium]